MHTRAVERQVEDLLKEHPQVVGIQHGGLAQRAKALRAVHAQVGVAAGEDAEVTLKTLESADAPGPVEVESVASVGLLHHQRRWQERLEQIVDDHWARARAARAVRRGEGLVDVDVQAIEAHLGRFDHAQNGVQVGAVAIHQTADAVDGGGYFAQPCFKEPEGIRVGQHQADHSVVQLGFKLCQVNVAIGVRGDRDTDKTGHGGGGRVGAVGRIGYQHLPTLVLAALQVVGAHHQHARQLALGAGRGLQCGGREASDGRQQPLKLEHDAQRALDGGVRLERVDVRDPRQTGHVLVDPRVVLHGARAQRVEDGVDGEVALSQMGEVTHDVELADLRQAQRRAEELTAQVVDLGHVERWKLMARRARPR